MAAILHRGIDVKKNEYMFYACGSYAHQLGNAEYIIMNMIFCQRES